MPSNSPQDERRQLDEKALDAACDALDAAMVWDRNKSEWFVDGEHRQHVANAIRAYLAAVDAPAPTDEQKDALLDEIERLNGLMASMTEDFDKRSREFSKAYVALQKRVSAPAPAVGSGEVIEALEAYKALAEYCVREAGPCEHETGHCVCRELGDLSRASDILAALRSSPPAPSREAAILAELELMTSDADTEEAAQCDKRWHPWAMRQASIIHGGNATRTVASAIEWARALLDRAPTETPK